MAGEKGTPGREPRLSIRQTLPAWVKIAALSFGGPAGQIAVMHRVVVDERGWVSEPRFLHALNFCMLLPGPEAQQLATYLGWLMNGVRGGLVAGGLFILPGAVAILALSFLYEPIREVWIHDEGFGASRLSMMRILERRTKAMVVRA